mgnify:CR=1 FL=1
MRARSNRAVRVDHDTLAREADDGSIEILSDTVAGNRRTIRLALVAPSADRQELLIEDGDAMRHGCVLPDQKRAFFAPLAPPMQDR